MMTLVSPSVADLQHVGKHGVGGLGGEDRVLEQDQQRPDIVLPATH